MIHKQQEQPQQALECLQAICDHPPPPLSQADIWYLIGSVQETMEPPAPEFAKQAYDHVLRLMQMHNDPKVSRVYRQLGWVCHKWALDLPQTVVQQLGMQQVIASPLTCLLHALETDTSDAQNWHLLGKCMLDHMELAGAYDTISHAIGLDPSNSEIWATVGTLYLARGQASDAVVAYEHAVHLNPGSPAWFDLGAARHHIVSSSPSPPDPTAITAAVEAYTKALSICTAKRDDICARLEHLQQLQSGEHQSAPQPPQPPQTPAGEGAASSADGGTPPMQQGADPATGGAPSNNAQQPAAPDPAAAAQGMMQMCNPTTAAYQQAAMAQQPPPPQPPPGMPGQPYPQQQPGMQPVMFMQPGLQGSRRPSSTSSSRRQVTRSRRHSSSSSRRWCSSSSRRSKHSRSSSSHTRRRQIRYLCR